MSLDKFKAFCLNWCPATEIGRGWWEWLDISALETYFGPRPASIVLSERNPPYTTHSCAYGTPRGYFIRCGNPGEYFPRFVTFHAELRSQ
jgi:hypothetical protein